jgi:hypothetical protein
MMVCDPTGVSILRLALNVAFVWSFGCSGIAIDSWSANFSACRYIEIAFPLASAAILGCPARQFIRSDFVEPDKLD